MTVFAQSSGQRIVTGKVLSTTAATTLITATADITHTVESIHWSVDTAGSTLSIWWNDGVADYYLMRGETEAANTRDQITDVHVVLRAGYTLKAQAGTASKIDVTVVTLQSNRSQ